MISALTYRAVTKYAKFIFASDGLTTEELVFLCPALSRPPKLVVEKYYISREYRVQIVVTRFVTKYNQQKEMIVIAAAETPASVFPIGDRGPGRGRNFKLRKFIIYLLAAKLLR